MKRLLSVLTLLCACTASAADRPNILYIALEDITPMMGCYGDTYAKTPNFDQLADLLRKHGGKTGEELKAEGK